MNTTYFLNLVAGNVFGTKTTPAIPSTYYIGLSSTTPTTSGTNVTEPSGGGYARVAFNSAMSEPTNGVITNSAAITFAESTADWFTSASPATYYVIYDAATGGNLLMYNALTHSRIIEINTIATIQVGSLVLQLTD